MRWLYQSNYPLSFLAAALFHFAVLSYNGLVTKQNLKVAMDQGRSSVEVDLVAAPPEVKIQPQPKMELPSETMPRIEPILNPPDPNEFVLPKNNDAVPSPKINDAKNTKSTEKVTRKIVVPPVDSKPAKVGDGSAIKPATDPTTIPSTGVTSEAKPDYIKNPKPHYPEFARKAGQEGLTIIHVKIDEDGKPVSVTIKKSSGFSSIDQEALRAVKKWMFRPERKGTLRVSYEKDIPVRFRLDGIDVE